MRIVVSIACYQKENELVMWVSGVKKGSNSFIYVHVVLR